MRNRYLAYDLIRKGKFTPPEKMIAVEEASSRREVVINWWCKQSGKSLTAIKMITDLIKKSDKVAVLIVKNISSKNMMINLLEKSIPKDAILRINSNVIILKNGSCIKVIASMDNSDNYRALMKLTLTTADLFIVDEFDYLDDIQMDHIIDAVKGRRKLNMIGRMLRRWGMFPSKKILFFSSMKDKRNFELLVLSVGDEAAFTYLNYEKLGLEKEKLVKILGENTFKRDYDSYFPLYT
jgi:hypothetical protein